MYFTGFNYADWKSHFEAAARESDARPVIFDERPLTATERDLVQKCIAQYQLGKSSDGAHLIGRMSRYGFAQGDPDIASDAVLFVQEEQRHAQMLSAFMQHHDMAPIKHHWVDTCFRLIRRMGNVELMLATLMTAEVISTHFYKCLGHATRSRMLKRMCNTLLTEETAHLYFLRQIISEIRKDRTGLHAKLTEGFERVLFFGALIAVWLNHAPVYRRAGTGWSTFWKIYWRRWHEIYQADPSWADEDFELWQETFTPNR